MRQGIAIGLLLLAGCSGVSTDVEEIAETKNSSSQEKIPFSSQATESSSSQGEMSSSLNNEKTQPSDSSSSSKDNEEFLSANSSALNTTASSASTSQDTILPVIIGSSSSLTESSSSKTEDPIAEKSYNIEVRPYQYDFAGMDFIRFKVTNNENFTLDSIELRLYITGTPAEVESETNNQPGSCPLFADIDICMTFDLVGFNHPCTNAEGNNVDVDLRNALRKSTPTKISNSYDPATGTYDWSLALPLATTVLEAGHTLRFDVGFSSGIYQYEMCEPLRTPSKKRFPTNSGDWSWRAHVASEDGEDYAGMPLEDKDYMDDPSAEIPVNPYVAVYRNGIKIWGITP